MTHNDDTAHRPAANSQLAVVVLNGPNLNRLGTREKNVYGRVTLETITESLERRAREANVDLVCRQSNYEGELISWVHEAADRGAAVIINPGGLTHTSVSLRDALAEVANGAGVMEVHLSNIHAREEFRHHSFISPIARGVIAGCGHHGYMMALNYLIETHAQASGSTTASC